VREYGVIIGDIVSSRSIDDWSLITTTMRSVFQEAKLKFGDIIEVGPSFTVGDEFQCVVSDTSKLFQVYFHLRLLSPVNFRCGLGIGEIEGKVSQDDAMRGKAFYRARDAIDACKKMEGYVVLFSNDYSNVYDNLFNAHLSVISDIEDHWTQRQAEVVKKYLLLERPKYEVMADHYNTTKQSISQVIIAAKLHLMDEVVASLRIMMMDERVLKLRKAKTLDTNNSSKNA
jgi:hypothetical protein